MFCQEKPGSPHFGEILELHSDNWYKCNQFTCCIAVGSHQMTETSRASFLLKRHNLLVVANTSTDSACIFLMFVFLAPVSGRAQDDSRRTDPVDWHQQSYRGDCSAKWRFSASLIKSPTCNCLRQSHLSFRRSSSGGQRFVFSSLWLGGFGGEGEGSWLSVFLCLYLQRVRCLCIFFFFFAVVI